MARDVVEAVADHVVTVVTARVATGDASRAVNLRRAAVPPESSLLSSVVDSVVAVVLLPLSLLKCRENQGLRRLFNVSVSKKVLFTFSHTISLSQGWGQIVARLAE